MKNGDFVYIPKLNRYGFVQETLPGGNVKTIASINLNNGKIEIIDVIDLIVEAVGLIKRLIVIVKFIFSKKNNVE